MASYPISGGCHCGAVRYRVYGPPVAVEHCHCSMCRKTNGSLSQPGASVEQKRLTIDQGKDNLTTYESSPGFQRLFCRTCGCHLFAYEDDEKELMYFMPATLDGAVHPGHAADREYHIHVGSKAEWERIGDDLPQYETAGPYEILARLQREPGAEGGR